MKKLTDITDVAEARAAFSWDRLWDLFDGTPENFNVAHECIDRHPPDRLAVRVKVADGRSEFAGGPLVSSSPCSTRPACHR